MGNGHLELIDHDQPNLTPVVIDFVSGKVDYRRKYGHAGGEAISKAVGIKQGWRPKIIDATAGLGRDAFVLATLGCRVHMIERCEMIAKLLEDGLRRAKGHATVGTLINKKLSLAYGDSRKELLHTPFDPEVIYLDPMFPDKKGTALVKKDMRILQCIAGKDADSGELLKLSLSIATKRVVVKRPAHANHLAALNPQMSVNTKKYRFDVYLITA